MRLTILFVLISVAAMAQDTLKTTVQLTAKQLASITSLEKEKNKVDSIYNVKINNIFDFILDANKIDIKDVVGIEPKGNGKLIVKTKKK